MPIPVSTTTISVLRGTASTMPYTEQDPYGEGYGSKSNPTPSQAWQVIASGVRAIIGSPSGSEETVGGVDTAIGGQQSTVSYKLTADPCDCIYTDRVLDESTGLTYNVTWTMQRGEFGMTRVTGGLKRTEGHA